MPKIVKCRQRGCGNEFEQYSSLQTRCYECLVNTARKTRKREEAKAAREAKAKRRAERDAVKTRSEWTKEAQQAFNRYIRLRDKGLPCISCDKIDDGSHQRHASHYRPAGIATALRFHEHNVHASCAQCNSHKSGNLVEYRIRLVKKIGKDAVKYLESQNATHKWDIDDLKEIKSMYKEKAKLLTG